MTLAQVRLCWAVKTVHLQNWKKSTKFLKAEFLPYAWSGKLENRISWKAERKVSFPQGRSPVTREWNQKEMELSGRKASSRKAKSGNKHVGMAGWMHLQLCYGWLGQAISPLCCLSASSSLPVMAALQVLLAVTDALKGRWVSGIQDAWGVWMQTDKLISSEGAHGGKWAEKRQERVCLSLTDLGESQSFDGLTSSGSGPPVGHIAVDDLKHPMCCFPRCLATFMRRAQHPCLVGLLYM